MNSFLSCDWGTSSFRLRLVDAETLQIIGEVKSGQGIAATHREWLQEGGDRAAFYTAIIHQHKLLLSEQIRQSLNGLSVILSGMASSTIGMVDMPYKHLPFGLDGGDLEVKVLTDANGPLIIISGACTVDDVMRGEETKLIGCAASFTERDDERLIIMPGTHPKHIFIKGDKAIGFKTYMTGEFFDLLSSQSILAGSVAAGGELKSPENRDNFIDGVVAGKTTNLLHAAFMVRTNQVLKKISPQQNYHYLSGLLIGAELKDISPGTGVYLVSGPTHLALYALACEVMGIHMIKEIDADNALIKGQALVFERYFKG